MLQVVVLLLQLSPAACCRPPAFVCCPSAANVTACLASTRHTHDTHTTHTHTHVCSSALKMGHLNVSHFPETKAMPFNFGLSLATLLCVPSRWLPNGRIPSRPAPSCASLGLCTTKKKGRGCSAQSGGSNRRMERRNCGCTACSFVRSAKKGMDRMLLFVTVIQETMTVKCYTRIERAFLAHI